MHSQPEGFSSQFAFVHSHVAKICNSQQNHSLCWEVWRRIKGLAGLLAECSMLSTEPSYQPFSSLLHEFWHMLCCVGDLPGECSAALSMCVTEKFCVFCQWIGLGRCMAVNPTRGNTSDKYGNLILSCFSAFLISKFDP